MRSVLVALAVFAVACKREEPAPVVTAAPSASAPLAFVQVRPRDHVLGDPAPTKLTFDLAVGSAGTLRVELVDRVALGHAMALEPRDPHALLIVEHELKPPRAVLEVRLEKREGALTAVASVEVAGKRIDESAMLPASLAVAPVRSATIDRPAMLPAGAYVSLAGLSWNPQGDAWAVDEAASAPHLVVRVRFTAR